MPGNLIYDILYYEWIHAIHRNLNSAKQAISEEGALRRLASFNDSLRSWIHCVEPRANMSRETLALLVDVYWSSTASYHQSISFGLSNSSYALLEYWEVFHALGPEAWERAKVESMSTQSDSASLRSYPFDAISSGHPSHLHPFRNNVWSGMDEMIVRVAKEYLRSDSSSTSTSPGGGGTGCDQVVAVATHWEEDVPWSLDEDLGVFKWFKLGGGKGLVEE
ncbi:hypothetical protein F5876DRAFT_83160 [Lentinula aff. lateritia]|uniref:Uncharacterized protein n=1 Tax=Lentinula aff. lateritia TaxID=2804960 RepID=A0ACC1TID2_9AGAR|nr:hypothetical protein F5876DRAFT_83160 [Lentinula aff. lateritia]